jgi:hypothetical protein
LIGRLLRLMRRIANQESTINIQQRINNRQIKDQESVSISS